MDYVYESERFEEIFYKLGGKRLFYEAARLAVDWYRDLLETEPGFGIERETRRRVNIAAEAALDNDEYEEARRIREDAMTARYLTKEVNVRIQDEMPTLTGIQIERLERIEQEKRCAASAVHSCDDCEG